LISFQHESIFTSYVKACHNNRIRKEITAPIENKMRCSKKSELCDLRILKMLTFRDGVSFGEALGKILINLKRNDDILNTLKNCGAQCVSLHSAALGHFPYCPYPRAVPADIKYSIRAIIILLMLRDLKWRIFW